jgi:MSHA biogenesis protein MshE
MNVPFSRFLVQTKTIDQTTYQQIMEFTDPLEMGDYLNKKNIINKSEVNNLLQTYNGFHQCNLSAIDVETVRMLPKHIAEQHTCMLISIDDDYATVAMANPLDEDAIDNISVSLQTALKIVISNESDLISLISNYYLQPQKISELSNVHINHEPEDIDKNALSSLDHNHGLDQLITSILHEAASQKATDIHIENHNDILKVFYRVNQRIYSPILLNSDLAHPLKQKLLLLADGKITDSQKAQELSFKFDYNNNDIFTRMSLLPTISGYSIVIRLFHQQDKDFFSLNNIVADSRILHDIKSMLDTRKGMLILSGPVNTGKTTTLYSLMQELAKDNRVMISAEDPVEVRFNNINQIMVNDDKEGLSFVDVVKASMRQNPDLISVGEIRDSETANMSMRACITGTMVFSSIHATSCINTISRFIDLGAETYLMSSSIKLILSQRLFRVLCDKCKVPTPMSPDIATILKNNDEEPMGEFFSSKGCDFCHKTGYTGYLPIFESLHLTEELSLLATAKTFTEFKKLANKQLKKKKLINTAFDYCKKGLVSLIDLKRLALEHG